MKDIVDEKCELSVRAGVLMERVKAYEPELPKDMEPMVYVNYCEKSEVMDNTVASNFLFDVKNFYMTNFFQ